jgi:hypothetical protein
MEPEAPVKAEAADTLAEPTTTAKAPPAAAEYKVQPDIHEKPSPVVAAAAAAAVEKGVAVAGVSGGSPQHADSTSPAAAWADRDAHHLISSTPPPMALPAAGEEV